MSCCNEVLTYVYSSPCISYLRDLVKSLDSTFSVKDKLDDMFWYGVFCNVETYANYRWYNRCNEPVPGILMANCEPSEAKMDYVESILEKVLTGEIEKPGWMFFVEETETFNKYNDSPSTFLYLIPKDEKYRKFGEALINFLYSPNMLMTLKR